MHVAELMLQHVACRCVQRPWNGCQFGTDDAGQFRTDAGGTAGSDRGPAGNRDDQKELMQIEKNRAEAAAAVAEEPPKLDAHEVRAMPSLCTTLQPLTQGLCFVPGLSMSSRHAQAQSRVWPLQHACLPCVMHE